MHDDATPVTVGIDLGTTWSLIGTIQDGVPTLIPNALGEVLTASAVSVDTDSTVMVGAPAHARIATHPDRTAAWFKRDMGTDRVFDLGGERYTPPTLSALVLGSLMDDARAALGRPVAGAVVTVPAYFDDNQRQAVRAAAEIAGLPIQRIINEPTAAAVAYGLHERDRELRALVLDLGGGTFDVTVLEIIEGVIEIQASAGDSRLGGEDFVDLMADWAVARIEAEHGVDVKQNRRGWARVREACESAKRHLSRVESTNVVLPRLPVGDQDYLDAELAIDRDRAEALWSPLLARLRGPIQQAVLDAGIGPADVDEVILVGGATRMPCVLRLTAQIFGRMPQRCLPPDEAVALGATLMAGMQADDAELEDLVVTDIAPFTLGISAMAEFGGQSVPEVFAPILERGTVIPASRVKTFTTVAHGQRTINIEVYQGEHSHCQHNRKIGHYELSGIPPGPAGSQPVEVRFTYDLNGIIEVEMTVASTGQVRTLVIEENPGRLTPAQIERARGEMAQLKIHPRDALPNSAAMARADALYQRLTGPEREHLGELIGAFRAALESQDQASIETIRAALLDQLAGWQHQST
jgi:molecular chaperone HscC